VVGVDNAIQAAVAARRSSARHGGPATPPNILNVDSISSATFFNSFSVNPAQGSFCFAAETSITRRNRMPSAACARMCGLPILARLRIGEPTTFTPRTVSFRAFISSTNCATFRSVADWICASRSFTATSASLHGKSITW